MRIVSRRRAIAFFITLGVCLVGLAVALNVGWIILNVRQVVPLVLGVIFFLVIIAGLILNTIFLVREVRRNEQHDSFINAVTHELKTPLTSIRLYLQTLESRKLDDAQRQEFYRVMLADTDRLMATVEQVLKAGEATQKGRPERQEPVRLDALAQECLELARARYSLPSGSLRYSGAARNGGATVLGDAEELRTAISNVIDNAIKYSPGEVKVSVELFRPDPQHVALRVTDRGVGIPRSELKQVFKRFYRVRNRATTHVKGTGLGLFMVRSIVRRYGGDAYADSAGEGRGTTVVITLPTAAA